MRYAIGALLLILVLVSAGCVQQLAAENETVKIGVLEPLSGVRAEAGQYVKNALELALDEINNDTSRRYRIQLIYEDSQYDPKVAVSGFQKLKDIDNVKFIIGEHGSSPTLAVAPLAEEAKIILISPAAQASELSKAGDYIFRTQINVAQEAPFLANFIVSVAKNETLHVIGINTDYTLSFMNSFSPEFERLGRKTGLVEKFDAKETDFRTILLKIQNEKPKYVLLLSIPKQAGLIIRQASELGMDVTWFAGSPIEGQEFFTSAGNVSATIIYSYPYDDVSEDTAMKTFREKYLTKYGVRNEMLSANAYDTLYIMSNCFEKVGIDVDAVKQCLYDTKDYKGASGTLTFDENGDVQKPFVMKTVRNGTFVKLETSSNPVKIGVILPLTGSASDMAARVKNGIDLALEEIKQNYPNTKIVLEDDKCDPATSVSAFNKLTAADNVQMIIGSLCSSAVLSVAPQAETSKIVQFSLGSSPKIRYAGDYIFSYTDAKVHAEMMSDFAKQNNMTRISILYINNDYGVGYRDAFVNRSVINGLGIAGQEAYQQNEKDFRTNLAKANTPESDAMLVVGLSNDYPLIIRQAKELGITKIFLAANTVEFPDTGSALNETNYTIYYTYAADVPQWYIDKYRAKYSTDPDYFAGVGYDSFIISFDAAKGCSSTECIKNAMYATNYQGAGGFVGFDKDGIGNLMLVIKTYRNGEFVKVE